MGFLERRRHPWEDDLELDNYTEQGVDKGAHLADSHVTNPDMVRIFEATKPLGLDEALYGSMHMRESLTRAQ
ncbi:MAG: hypothetical protein IJM58_02445 [Muribaculaceae bacterium]|nr:hypothetical protein [Muribaculaceae bacterium]